MKTINTIVKYYILIIILVLLPISCNVLDQSPVDSFNEESLFQDVNLVEAFLFQCYDQIGGDKNEMLGMREDLLSSSTDELLNIHRAGNVTFTKGTMTPSYLGHFNSGDFYSWILWDDNYKNIKNVNTLLGGIDNVPINTTADEEKIKLIKAEAYFIRAFNYTNLLRSYGGVVLVDKKFEMTDDFSIPTRSSIQETLDFILIDIEKAIADLPSKGKIEQGRATKGAAAALKSRLLSFVSSKLTNGGFHPTNTLVSFPSGSRTKLLQDAKQAAKDILDGKYGNYSLTGTIEEPPANMSEEEIMMYADNYASVFLQKGAWNDEVIFGVQYIEKQGNQTHANLWWGPNGYNCWGNNEPSESLVREYEMADGSKFEWDRYNKGETAVRAFTKQQLESDPNYNPYNGREPRFYASILYDQAPWRDRASTNNEVEIANIINSSGQALIGKSISEIIKRVGELEAVTKGGEDSRSAANQAWNGTKTGYYLRKMLDVSIDGETKANENAWLEMRLAEVYLDYAEACIELGEIAEGIKAVNIIRNRAGLPGRPSTTNKEQATEWYRHERLIEMMGEGDRWYSIRKWMICDQVIKNIHPIYIYHFNDGVSIYLHNTTTLADNRTWVDRQYWLPISTVEMNKATQLQQNPDYQ